MPGRRLASIVFPEPGGPISMMLCPPAAAISIQRLTLSWPFTSAKSNSGVSTCLKNSSRVSISTRWRVFSPLRKSITCLIFSAPYTSKLFTIAASLAFCIGRIKPLNPSFLACMAIGSAPLMGCRLPSRESSPMMIYRSISSHCICPLAAKIPIAKLRS